MPNRVTVSSADFIRNVGYWQSEALRSPVSITHHGRERLVLAAAEEFRRAVEVSSDGVQRELVAARGGHAMIIENLEEGFIQFDAQSRLSGVNRIAEALLAGTRESLMGLTLPEVLPEMAANSWASQLQRVLRTRKAQDFQVQVHQAHLSVRIFPLQEGAGALFHNITELVGLKTEHEVGQAVLRALEQLADVAIIGVDARARIESINTVFSRASGFSAADVIGHRLIDLVGSTQRRQVNAALEQTLSGGAHESVDITILCKKGGEASGRISFAPVVADFSPRGAIGAWRVSEQAMLRSNSHHTVQNVAN